MTEMKLSSVVMLVVAVVVLTVAVTGEVEGQALTQDTRLAGLPSRQVREVRGGDKKIKKKKKNSNERKNKVKTKGRI